MTFDQILASSTAIVNTSVGYLVGSLSALLPLLLSVAIPIGLLLGIVYWIRHRGARA